MLTQRKDTLKYGGTFDKSSLENKLKELQNITVEQNFWDNSNNAKKILQKINIIETEIKMWENFDNKFQDTELYYELLNEDESLLSEAIDSINKLDNFTDKVEVRKMLNGEDDHRGAILTIHPGAGGTESQDWASMLFRLYSRWCEKNNLKVKILDYQDGDEAGIKDVSIEIPGDFINGHLKAERGVHRLVRISPFDSNSRRHTSFASVFVYPLIEDDIEIDIDEKEIRIDTYRASGAGGQHVNKTDSAVRITHIPTNIVVQCQNQRSQLKNKNVAMKMLKAKLYQNKQEELALEQEKLEGQKKEIGWGSQIRSYVFHPYNLVKDHRTKEETSNIQAVMDGSIDNFIRAYLLKNLEKNERVG